MSVEAKNLRLDMRVSSEFLKSIDDWRRLQPKIVSMSEAIRILVSKGLTRTKPQLDHTTNSFIASSNPPG
jgi:hypothetical protein